VKELCKFQSHPFYFR